MAGVDPSLFYFPYWGGGSRIICGLQGVDFWITTTTATETSNNKPTDAGSTLYGELLHNFVDVAGHATVLVFPDLNTGNATYKAVQQSSKGVLAIGPLLQVGFFR